MGLFTKDVKIRTPVQTREAAKALLKLGTAAVPGIPTREVAGLSELEQQARGLAGQYGTAPSAEVESAISALTEAGQGVESILDIPEYEALYKQVLEQGRLEANRLGRTLQLSGNASSGSGANVLGRQVEQTQQNLLATLAPYTSAERGRSLEAITGAAGMRTADTQGRLAALSQVGELDRSLEQLRNDAAYAAVMQQIEFPYQYQVPALQAAAGAQPTAVKGGGLTDLGFGLQTLSSMFSFSFGD